MNCYSMPRCLVGWRTCWPIGGDNTVLSKPVPEASTPLVKPKYFCSRNPKAAIRVLQAALQDEPHNLAIQVTLLRAFAEGGHVKEYRQLAAHLQPQLEQQAIWQQIRKTGQTLLPHDELFR